MSHRKVFFLVLVSLGLGWIAAAAFASPAVPQTNPGKTIKLKVTAEVANIRIKPSIGSNIIRQFPAGAILEAGQKDGEWYLIKMEPDEAGNVSGYVHESLVLPLDALPAAALPTTEAPPAVAKAPETKPAIKIVPPKTEVVAPVTDEIPIEEGAESPVSFALWVGGGLTVVGDLNTGAAGLADYYAAQVNKTADRDVSAVRAGFQFGGEVAFSIAPGLKVAVGAEYLKAARESLLTFGEDEPTPSTLTVKPGYSALPVHLAFVYYPLDFLYLKAGVGYYFASADYQYTFTSGDVLRDWQGEATAAGAGVLGGIGLDLSLAQGVAFTAELCGRYAVISGFSGTDTYQDEDLADPYVEEGRLYAYDARTSSQTAYSLVFIRGKKPAESGVEKAREAKLDLSGVSLKIGFRYKF